MKRSGKFRDRLCLWFGGVIATATILGIWLSYLASMPLLMKEFGGQLKSVAAGVATEIDGDVFAALKGEGHQASPAYYEIKALLRRHVEANTHVQVKFAYTMAPTDDPHVWQYVVDATGESSPEFSPRGSIESFVTDDVVLDAARLGIPVADEEIRTYPQWGPLLAAAAPIRNSAGDVVGVVGIDAPPSSVVALRRTLRFAAIACLALAAGVALAASALVAWQVTKPLDALITATHAVGAGNLRYRVEVTSRDELGQLAEAFNEMTEGLRQRELYKQQFERYVSRQIAEKVLADPDTIFWKGERRRATILFSDIRGFTAMSSRLDPEVVVARLNEYLGEMIDIIFEHDGTLDKFIGDAVMAVFGAPVSLGNDEERAVRAAVAMQEAASRLRARWEASGAEGFRIGIGINTGEVIVGNMGSERRLEYTAIGDPVNVASRLEALTKEYATSILISEATYQAVAHIAECCLVDCTTVRGREAPIRIYEVLRIRDGAAT
ncbi:MAG TPA: adenylate/guanylate cyclase domain-containing protein [Armatimonadota bacterium]|nr:adenylate/guanylate cyclase domain-containing protein [Armatimonadota bacterium]HOM83345.1 adenylate/guanylate cyclase domain-containing protein [Armatimonadota bacterium]HPO72217.1 adenylate/guanylate cyclase domain-containing protein [Armatimonadota bacterium]HPT97476.1 adenylate/guanylate cyclase domain-containing protein [Armatimonadota bacterium]